MVQPSATQLVLEMCLPTRRAPYDWQSGICQRCGLFSFKTAPSQLSPKRRRGIKQVRVSSPRYCELCMPPIDLGRGMNNRHQRISATTVVQFLYGCPRAYQLRIEHPKQPTSLENAFGRLYHLGRQTVAEKSFHSYGAFYVAPQVGLRALLQKTEGNTFFRHRISSKRPWEIPSLRYLLSQILVSLWKGSELAPLNERFQREGVETPWWEAEMRLPPLSLTTLNGSLEGVAADGEVYLTGTIDLIILRQKEGRHRLEIVDHKIRGVDLHPELNGEDSWLQLQLYACWAAHAFNPLGVNADDISLWIHELCLNPIRVEKKHYLFSEETRQATLQKLSAAMEKLREFRHPKGTTRLGFPSNPRPWLCQVCDFGFTPKLCQDSQATRGAWGFSGLPYAEIKSAKEKQKEASQKCPFCRAPMIESRYGRLVCSQRLYDDCPRDDR